MFKSKYVRNLFECTFFSAIVLLLLLSVAAYFSAFDFRLDICSQFRMPYFALSLLFLGCSYYIFKTHAKLGKVYIVISIITLFLNLIDIGYVFLMQNPLESLVKSQNYSNSLTQAKISVFTLVKNAKNKEDVLYEITKQNPDAVVIQNYTEEWGNNFPEFKKDYRYGYYYAKPSEGGIGIFSKTPLTDRKIIHIADSTVPVLKAKIFNDITLLIVSTPPYTNPNNISARNKILYGLASFLSTEKLFKEPIIIIGSMNTNKYSSIYKFLLRKSHLKDNFNILSNPLGTNFERVLSSSEVKIKDFNLDDAIESDHAVINFSASVLK